MLVVVRGGAYGAGTPREGWDHSTGYLRRIIADVWGADLTLVEREFTLVGVNPALDDFKELADQFTPRTPPRPRRARPSPPPDAAGGGSAERPLPPVTFPRNASSRPAVGRSQAG